MFEQYEIRGFSSVRKCVYYHGGTQPTTRRRLDLTLCQIFSKLVLSDGKSCISGSFMTPLCAGMDLGRRAGHEGPIPPSFGNEQA